MSLAVSSAIHDGSYLSYLLMILVLLVHIGGMATVGIFFPHMANSYL